MAFWKVAPLSFPREPELRRYLLQNQPGCRAGRSTGSIVGCAVRVKTDALVSRVSSDTGALNSPAADTSSLAVCSIAVSSVFASKLVSPCLSVRCCKRVSRPETWRLKTKPSTTILATRTHAQKPVNGLGERPFSEQHSVVVRLRRRPLGNSLGDKKRTGVLPPAAIS